MPSPETSNSEKTMRSVRSFVRREGRVTPGQKQALEQLWPVYGFAPETFASPELDFVSLFGRDAPVILEIGYGDGEALVDIASNQPENNFIGAEVYSAGVGHCLMRAQQLQLGNLKLSRLDAVELLKNHIPDASLAEIRLFFPDPWPKKKHHKRRIVNEEFTRLIGRKLSVGGQIHFATDWAPYTEWAMDILEASPLFENIAGAGKAIARPETRIVTKFERRGERLGQPSQDMIYRKVS